MASMTIEQALESGLQHHRAGRLAEAERLYRQVLATDANQPSALHLLGVLAQTVGHYQTAVDLIRHAIRLSPAAPEYHNDLALALHDLGRLDEAAHECRAALRLKPDYANALSNLGLTLTARGKLEEAASACRQALSVRPDFVKAHNNLGIALAALGRLDEAIEVFRAGLLIDPGFADLHNNLGNALKLSGKLDDAIAEFQQAEHLSPNDPRPASNRLNTIHFHSGYSAAAILREHREFDQRFARPLRPQIFGHLNPADPSRRLRIGYVSPDFRDHCQSLFTLPLLRAHDKSAVQVFCYSDVVCPDETTREVQSLVDCWRPLAGLSDPAVVELIRADGIDVLVDLTMHMSGGRPLLFARKPAPVQISWLAYPGTSGIGTIDYRLTDPSLDPPGTQGDKYLQHTLWLPDSFWCYEPRAHPPVNPPPAAAAGYITFGCLNGFCKVTDRTLELWSEVLGAVPESRLLLLAPPGHPRDRVSEFMVRRSVAPGRLEYTDYRPRAEYLVAYHRIDIALDTFPYNGHTTSLDAMWMGVPVITMPGQTVVGRAGVSQLTNLGLEELIAPDPPGFVRLAADLAADSARLSSLRQGLRARMKQSPLMDATRFAHGIESVYRAAWVRWCEDQDQKGKNAPSRT